MEANKFTARRLLKSAGYRFIDRFTKIIGKHGTSPRWGLGSFRVETIRLELPRLPAAFSGFRMAQISDIHMGGWMNRQRFARVADIVAAQAPDVLLISGDFLLGYSFSEVKWQSLQDLSDVLSPLASVIPTFAVLGNHDLRINPQAVRQMLASSGVTDLTNTVVRLTRDGQALHLCGVDDVRYGDVRLETVLAQLNDDQAAILLAHEPDYADISAATGKFDLQVSGHTHGGQVVLPFLGPPLLPRLGRHYPSGLYRVKNMFLYTNRGVGMHRIAFRFNCPAEITLFELHSAHSPA